MEMQIGCCCKRPRWLNLGSNPWIFGTDSNTWRIRSDGHTEAPGKRDRDFDWQFALTGAKIDGKRVGRLSSFIPTDWPDALVIGTGAGLWQGPSDLGLPIQDETCLLIETDVRSAAWRFDDDLNAGETLTWLAALNPFLTTVYDGTSPGPVADVHDWLQGKRIKATFPGASLRPFYSFFQLDLAASESGEEYGRTFSGAIQMLCVGGTSTRFTGGPDGRPDYFKTDFFVALLMHFRLEVNPDYDSGLPDGPQNEPLQLAANTFTTGSLTDGAFMQISAIVYNPADRTEATITWSTPFAGGPVYGTLNIEYS